MNKNKVKNKSIFQIICLIAGIITMTLGIIGLLLPVIPQVPFLIAALFCFSKYDERFHAWVVRNPLYKRFLAKYLEGRDHLAHDSRSSAKKGSADYLK